MSFILGDFLGDFLPVYRWRDRKIPADKRFLLSRHDLNNKTKNTWWDANQYKIE